MKPTFCFYFILNSWYIIESSATPLRLANELQPIEIHSQNATLDSSIESNLFNPEGFEKYTRMKRKIAKLPLKTQHCIPQVAKDSKDCNHLCHMAYNYYQTTYSKFKDQSGTVSICASHNGKPHLPLDPAYNIFYSSCLQCSKVSNAPWADKLSELFKKCTDPFQHPPLCVDSCVPENLNSEFLDKDKCNKQCDTLLTRLENLSSKHTDSVAATQGSWCWHLVDSVTIFSKCKKCVTDPKITSRIDEFVKNCDAFSGSEFSVDICPQEETTSILLKPVTFKEVQIDETITPLATTTILAKAIKKDLIPSALTGRAVSEEDESEGYLEPQVVVVTAVVSKTHEKSTIWNHQTVVTIISHERNTTSTTSTTTSSSSKTTKKKLTSTLFITHPEVPTTSESSTTESSTTESSTTESSTTTKSTRTLFMTYSEEVPTTSESSTTSTTQSSTTTKTTRTLFMTYSEEEPEPSTIEPFTNSTTTSEEVTSSILSTMPISEEESSSIPETISSTIYLQTSILTSRQTITTEESSSAPDFTPIESSIEEEPSETVVSTSEESEEPIPSSAPEPIISTEPTSIIDVSQVLPSTEPEETTVESTTPSSVISEESSSSYSPSSTSESSSSSTSSTSESESVYTPTSEESSEPSYSSIISESTESEPTSSKIESSEPPASTTEESSSSSSPTTSSEPESSFPEESIPTSILQDESSSTSSESPPSTSMAIFPTSALTTYESAVTVTSTFSIEDVSYLHTYSIYGINSAKRRQRKKSAGLKLSTNLGVSLFVVALLILNFYL